MNTQTPENTKKIKIRRSQKKEKISVFSVLMFLMLLLYCLILFTMVVWTVFSSVKHPWDFDDNPISLPEKWLIAENFRYVLKYFTYNIRGVKANILQMFGNAFLYAGGCATAQVICMSMMAYVTARFKNYKMSKIIYAIVLFVMVFPIIGSGPSEMQFVTKLGFKNHIWAMWILKFNFLGLYFLIFHAAFGSVPDSYAEAAKIDGANNYQIMIRIFYPLILPILSTVWLLIFVSMWNDYQVPLLYIPEKPTISYGLYRFYSNMTHDTPYKLMACLVVLVPILIVFMIFKNKLMGKLSLEGGVKG